MARKQKKKIQFPFLFFFLQLSILLKCVDYRILKKNKLESDGLCSFIVKTVKFLTGWVLSLEADLFYA